MNYSQKIFPHLKESNDHHLMVGYQCLCSSDVSQGGDSGACALL